MRNSKGQFLPGNPGRIPGSRNQLQGEFFKALAADFAENGVAAIKIVRVESPKDYLKIVASVMPKEFLLNDGTFDDLSDEEIAQALATIRQARTTEPADDEAVH